MLRRPLLVALCLCLAMSASCASSQPFGSPELRSKVRADYDAALELMTNKEIDKDAEVLPEHVGMSIRLGALSLVAQRAVLAGLLQRINTEEHALDLKAFKIPVGLTSKLVDLKLLPSEACPTCLSISGTLAGKYTFSKDVGEPDAYSSSFSMVAPLAFGASDKGGAMYLDLSQVAQLGGFAVESKLSSIPEKLREPLVKYLDKYIVQKVAQVLKPVKLMEFGLPSFGVEGLAFLPSDLSIDLESKTVAMTMHSNIKTPAHRIDALRQLGPDDVFGVGVHLDLLTRLLNASMAQESTPYTYDAAGTKGGAYHVVPLSFNAHASDDGDLTKVSMDFDVFRFDTNADASRGSFRAILLPAQDDQGEMTWEVSEVLVVSTVYGALGIDPQRWRQAAFLTTAAGWLDSATRAPSVPVPGVRAASFGAKGLQVEGNGVSAMFGLSLDDDAPVEEPAEEPEAAAPPATP